MQKRMTIQLAVFLAVSVVQAADYTWLAAPLSAIWDTATENWDLGAWSNTQATNHAAFGASSIREINVDGEMSAGAVAVSGADYTFTNGQVTLNGPFTVGSGNSADVYSAIQQTDSNITNRFSKAGAGTLTLHCDADKTNTVYRLQQLAGTTVLDGGTLYLNGTSTSPEEGKVLLSLLGGTLVISGGATLAMTNTKYVSSIGCSVLITNGTLDASQAGEFLHGFKDNGEGTTSAITVQDEGTLLANDFRISKDSRDSAVDGVSVNVNTGGTFRIRRFTMDEGTYVGSLIFKAAINLNGGRLVSITTNSNPIFGSDTSQYWKGINVYVREGGCYLDNEGSLLWVEKELKSGAEHDGGYHGLGKSVVYLWKTNSYNGGTYLEGARGGILAVNTDRSFGAVPPEPTNNVFFNTANSYVLHFGSSFNVHSNRDFLIASNTQACVGIQNSNTVRWQGRILADEGVAIKHTSLRVTDGWKGLLVLDPGEGRTNNFGRIVANGRVEFASGTTILTSANGYMVNESAQLYAGSGQLSSFSSDYANIIVSGGVLKAGVDSVYLEVSHYGQFIVKGGLASFPNTEFLTGLSGPGRVYVSGSGVLDCAIMRISQSTNAASVNVCTGGVLRLNNFSIDTGASQLGIVNFDGGTVVAKGNTADFLGTDNLKWRTNIFCYVKEGGAVISNANDNHIKNSLYSGAEHDGGLIKLGAGALVLRNTNTYNGVTAVKQGVLCLRWPYNGLPPTNTLAVYSNAVFHTYLGSAGAIGTQTFARVEGAGRILYSDNITVTDSIAPGDGTNGVGTLTFDTACVLGGTLEIDGDGTNSDCLVVSDGVQDISGLTVKVNDFSKLSKKHPYTIFSAPGGFTGGMKHDFGKDSSWILKHDANAKKVYLVYNAGTVVMLM